MEPPGMEAPSTCTSWSSRPNALSRCCRLLGVLAAAYPRSRSGQCESAPTLTPGVESALPQIRHPVRRPLA